MDHSPRLEKGNGKVVLFATLFLCLLILTPSSSAQKLIHGPIPADVIAVLDGEHVKIHAKLNNTKAQNYTIKLLGIDSPDLDGACPQERALADKTKKRLATILGPKIILLSIQTMGNSLPPMAQVETISGMDPTHILTFEKLARPYWGGHVFGWCADQTTCLAKNCD